ncbi:MAG: DNA repair protein RecN [Dehalococcoidales bacterium]|nr:DNA repair protein RecN [Dehalococcoidales bacterium]
MLAKLRVRDIGIIEEIDWSLSSGLNVITGETGAGKSLVVDAVGALLAGKVDDELIRYGADRSQIEGVFVLPQYNTRAQLRRLLVDKGLEADEETLVISYESRRRGRSIVRVNGHAVPRGLVNQIGGHLIDIHSQGEHFSLLNREYHRYLLDAYAHILSLRRGFSIKATELGKVTQELKTLIEQERELARSEELWRFQRDEIAQAKLREGEQATLERERDILASAEQLKSLSGKAYRALCGGDEPHLLTSARDRMNEAVGIMKKLVAIDPNLKQPLEFMEGTVYGLEEVARTIQSYSERLEYDPRRLEEIESRLELIRNLKKKYGPTVTSVLDYLKRTEAELAGLSHSAERRIQLERKLLGLREEMGRMAAKLSQARSAAARELVTAVETELADLNMPSTKFEVRVTQQPSPEGIPLPDGESYAFSSDGVDNVEFMVSTNPGEPVKPLIKIASTGEISRFTLALKGALAGADNIPVLIFDEIDIGIGGRSGRVIGKKLWNLARHHQVICVTHLPQIAVFADAHYSVHKDASGSRTLSRLRALHGESRIKELTAMLGSRQYTGASLSTTHELIQEAEQWKQTQQ